MRKLILSLLVLAIFGSYLAAAADIPRNSDGYHYIINRRSGMLLSVIDGPDKGKSNTDNLDVIVQKRAYGEKYQQWDLRYFTEKGQKFYVFIARHSGKVLDVPELSKDNRKQLIQYDYNGGQNQHFKLVCTEGEWYRIIARHSNKYLEVLDKSLKEGAPIVQNARKTMDYQHQEWAFVKVDC